MNTTDLFLVLLVIVVVVVLVYLAIIMRRPTVKHGNERCEKMLKQLEDEPFNTTIGDDLYSAKTKKSDKSN